MKKIFLFFIFFCPLCGFSKSNIDILENQILSNIEIIRAKSCVLENLQYGKTDNSKRIYQIIINYDYYKLQALLNSNILNSDLEGMALRIHKALKPHVTVFEKKEIELVRQKMLSLRKNDFSCGQL